MNHHKLRYPDNAQLLESVNTYMTAFAAHEAAQARLQAKQRQEPDEDGFVTVTRSGRTGLARQEVAQEQAEKQRQRQKGLEDFYRFQSREKRKARAGELVKKFEDDKEKVKRMRERRGRLKVKLGSSFSIFDHANWSFSQSRMDVCYLSVSLPRAKHLFQLLRTLQSFSEQGSPDGLDFLNLRDCA